MGGVAGDLMSSCLTGHLRCKCDLILPLIGWTLLGGAQAGGGPCSVGTKPLLMPDTLVHNELNYWASEMPVCP